MKKIVLLIVLFLISLIVFGCGKSNTVEVNTAIPNETYVFPISPSSSAVGTYISYGEDDESPWLLVIGKNGTCVTRQVGWNYTLVGGWEIEDSNQLVICWNYWYDSDSNMAIYDERVKSIGNCNFTVNSDGLVGENGVIWVRYKE